MHIKLIMGPRDLNRTAAYPVASVTCTSDSRLVMLRLRVSTRLPLRTHQCSEGRDVLGGIVRHAHLLQLRHTVRGRPDNPHEEQDNGEQARVRQKHTSTRCFRVVL